MLKSVVGPVLRPIVRGIFDGMVSRPSPSLSLNFVTTDTLDSRITFTRSTTATRTNASGLLESVAINAPRFDYDPVTLQPKGLLIEEQRTNLLTYSDGTVANLGANSGVTTAASAISLSFTNSIQFGNNSVSRYAYKSATTTAATAYRLSIYIRMDDDSAPSITTDSLVGDCSLVAEGGVIGTPSVTAVGGSVYRATLAFTATGGTSNFGIVKYNTQSTKGFRITGYQLESGSFVTSYIPTVASQVTRAADSAVMTGTNFSSWYNQSAGTFYSEIGSMPTGVDRRWMAVSDGANGLMNARLSAGNLYVNTLQETSGTARSINGATVSATFVKVANTYAANDVATVTNSGTVYTGATWAVITATSLNIGANVTGFQIINGCVKRLVYYNRRLTNTELKGITA